MRLIIFDKRMLFMVIMVEYYGMLNWFRMFYSIGRKLNW